jgi:hypothetical protein
VAARVAGDLQGKRVIAFLLIKAQKGDFPKKIKII